MNDRCNLKSHSEQRFCCGSCARAFSSMVAFDWHRQSLSDGTRVCVDPSPATRKDGAARFAARSMPGKDGTPVQVWGTPDSDRTWWAS